MRSKAYGWYVVGLLAACNFLNYAHRNVLFSAYDDLRGDFHASNASLGLLGSVYMGAHALATLPAGWLGDRIDRRRLLAVAALIWSAGALVAAAAPDLITLGVARALSGLATAAVVPVCNAMVAEIFPAERKASVLAVFNLGLFLGGTIGYGLGAAVGHPAGVLGLAVPGLIAAALLVRLDVPGHGGARVSPGLAEVIRELRSIVGVRSLRWLMTSTTLMAFAAGGYQAWLLDFLIDGKGLTKAQASVVLGIAFFGGLVGVLAGGRVADRLRATRVYGRTLAITIGMGCTVPCALACIYVTNLWVLAPLAVLTLFFMSWYHGPMAASIDDLARPGQAVATQAVVIFTTHMLGTTPSSWVIGEIKDASTPHVAMLVPTALVGLAALAMSRTFSSFERDVVAAGLAADADR